MQIKPFEENKPYPEWDPDEPDKVPGIPNWNRNFGNIIIEFDKGTRTCYYHRKKKNKYDVECGDYRIKITYSQKNWNKKVVYDNDAWKWLVDCLDPTEINKFLCHLCKILDMNIDKDVYDYLINNVNFSVNNNDLRALLYYFWHRAIIEDRIYSQKKGYNGRKQVIGTTYEVLKELRNNQNRVYLYEKCDEIYKMAKKKL